MLRICGDCVDADVDVARDDVAGGVVEGDDVGVVVVLQILIVDFKNLFVAAEDVVYFADASFVVAGNGFNPLGNCFFIYFGEFDSVCVELY